MSLRRKWKTFRGDNECMAPVHSGFLQGRQSKIFALKLEGALVGSNGKDGWQSGRRRRKGESFVQIILLPVKKGFQQKAGMPRVVRVRPCSAAILAQVCW